MSFRLRVLGLLTLVAMAATAATGWLTLRQANRQVQETVTAGRQEVSRITGELRTYGFTHGTWDGLSPTVASLAQDTGQRIRVATESDVLLTDSDALAGRTPREPSSQPAVLVDPRPVLKVPAGQVRRISMKQVATAISDYRAEMTYAVCLTRAGAEPTARPDNLGIPRIKADRRPAQCPAPKESADPLTPADLVALQPCEAEQRFAACLQRVFNERIGSVAPPRLEVRLGVRNESAPTLAAAPTMAVAAGVALAVIAGALLLSSAVLRPVRAMTVAAKGLGEGDLGRRVPVSGRDEIAQLGGAFNRMADSIQAGEERQRRLTGDIAHELRTPLANLRGYLEALRDGVVDPTPNCSTPSTGRPCSSSGSWTTCRISPSRRRVRSPITPPTSTCATSWRPGAGPITPRLRRRVSRCSWRLRRPSMSPRTRTGCARSSATWSATRCGPPRRAARSAWP